MAVGTKSNFQIYHTEFFGGRSEVLAQNANAFNGASMNCLRLVTRLMRGDYERESFMAAIAASSLVTRRDVTDVTTNDTDVALTQDEIVGVKLNRKFQVADSLDAFRKVAPDEDAQRLFSLQLGKQTAVGTQLDYLNSMLIALEAALDGTASLEHDATDGTIQFSDLATGFSKMGDRAMAIRCIVMHSKPFWDLVSDGLTNYKVDVVAGQMVVSGPQLEAMGKRIVVTDSSSLVTASTPTYYSTLGLVEDAAEVAESEQAEVISDIITGKPNLILRIQGEHAFNVKLKGFKWDTSSGGANPDDTALGTEAYWVQAAADVKDCPGVIIKSQ